MRISILVVSAFLLAAGTAYAWDPVGDITHPDRIIRNIGREAENAGKTIENVNREALVQAGAPAFQQWLNASRNSASNGGTSPVPDNIRSQLEGFYDPDVLDNVGFKIGDGGVFNLANLSVQYGGAAAVTLIDVIVFANPNDAYNNVSIWAHELRHVKQFRDWGVRDFAIRYLRNWNAVEGEAYQAQRDYDAWRRQRGAMVSFPDQVPTLPPPGPPRPPIFVQNVAAVCATPFGYCPMGMAIPVGAPCACPGPGGGIQGIGR